MATSIGPNSGTTFLGNVSAPSGDIDWTGANNTNMSDNLRATVQISNPDEVSNYLIVKGFGFNISSGSVINGISVDIEKSQTQIQAGIIRDNSVKLLKNGTVIGNNKALTNKNWPPSDEIITYGNSTDLWGINWTSEDINNAGFGVALSVIGTPGGLELARVDYITITVNYTNPSEIGKIIIIKNTIPDDETEFSFTSNALNSSFVLQDNGNGSDGKLSTITFENLLPGIYDVSQTSNVNYTTTASCDDGSNLDVINLSARETITCTFTNTNQNQSNSSTSPDSSSGSEGGSSNGGGGGGGSSGRGSSGGGATTITYSGPGPCLSPSGCAGGESLSDETSSEADVDEETLEETLKPGFLSSITGAVIGFGEKNKKMLTSVALAIIAILIIIFFASGKGKN